MPLPVLSVVLVSYRGTCLGQRILFGMHYEVTENPSAGTVTADLTAIANFFAAPGAGSPLAAYLACLPSNYQCEAVRAQRVGPNRSVYIDSVVDLPGTFDDICLTANLQHPVEFFTANAGRSQIGVKKIGPAPTSAVVAGAPTNDYKFVLDTFADEFIDSQIVVMGGPTVIPVIYHVGNNQSDPIFSYRIPNRTGTMRRRTLRVGE